MCLECYKKYVINMGITTEQKPTLILNKKFFVVFCSFFTQLWGYSVVEVYKCNTLIQETHYESVIVIFKIGLYKGKICFFGLWNRTNTMEWKD